MSEERIAMVRNAIDNIMNDVLQKAYHHSINYPQNSNELNKLLKTIREDNDEFINRLHQVKSIKNDADISIELNDITKLLKKKSLIHLSELQKLKGIDKPHS